MGVCDRLLYHQFTAAASQPSAQHTHLHYLKQNIYNAKRSIKCSKAITVLNQILTISIMWMYDLLSETKNTENWLHLVPTWNLAILNTSRLVFYQRCRQWHNLLSIQYLEFNSSLQHLPSSFHVTCTNNVLRSRSIMYNAKKYQEQ